MSVLIIKIDSTGDVARTTALLRRLESNVTWVSAPHNTVPLERPGANVRCLAWEERGRARDRAYDLVINLKRGFDPRATEAIGVEEVFDAVLDRLSGAGHDTNRKVGNEPGSQ